MSSLASKLRHRITFQKQTEDQEDNGENIDEWLDVKTVWASINPLSGRELFAAETVNSEVTHKVNIRYTPNLLPSMRIKFGNRFFSIVSIINFQERNVEMQIMCKELI